MFSTNYDTIPEKFSPSESIMDEPSKSSSLLGKLHTNINYTILIYFCMLVIGTQESVTVMFLDIAHITHSTLPDIAFGISMKFVGYGIAYTIVELLPNRCRQITFTTAVILSSLSFSVLSMTPHIHVYYGAQFMNGFMAALIDTSVYAWIAEMWPESISCHLSLILFQQTGAAIGCLVVEPFLSSISFQTHEYEEIGVYHETRIQIPCLILTTTVMIPAILMLLLLYWRPYKLRSKNLMTSTVYGATDDVECSSKAHEENKCNSEAGVKQAKQFPTTLMKLLSCVMVTITAAGVMNASTFLPIFAVFCDFHQTKETAAHFRSLSSASAACMLSFTMWIGRRLQPQHLLFSGMTIAITGNLTALLALYLMERWLVWIAVTFRGLGFGILMPMLFTLLLREWEMTRRMYHCLKFCRILAEIMMPAIVGQFIEKQPNTFVYINLTCVSLSLILLSSFTLRK
jgi:MFS family permease